MSMLPYFPYNPFEWWPGEQPEPYYGTGKEQSEFAPSTFTGWGPSAAMREADPWRYNNWLNQNNMTVLSGDEKNGYEVMVKTGKTEGTVYNLLPDEQGGYVSKEIGKRHWDTNGSFIDQWGPLLPFLGAAAAYFGPSLLGSSSSASTAPAAAAPAATAPSLASPTLASEMLTPNFLAPPMSATEMMTIPGLTPGSTPLLSPLATTSPGIWGTVAPTAEQIAGGGSLLDKIGSVLGSEVVAKTLPGLLGTYLGSKASGKAQPGAGQPGAGQQRVANWSPAAPMQSIPYQPNAMNVAELQGLLNYLEQRGNPRRDAHQMMGGRTLIG